MDYTAAIKRLWNHANLSDKDSFLLKEESFCYLMWQAEQTSRQFDLDDFYADIMQCFEVINCTLNTNQPSVAIEGKAESIDRKLSYVVSLILSTSWSAYYRWKIQNFFSEQFLQKLSGILLKIEIAWNLVLAGDIDKIQQDAEQEFELGQ